MVKVYSFFSCIFFCKEKCLLGHTFRIWRNQSPSPNAAHYGANTCSWLYSIWSFSSSLPQHSADYWTRFCLLLFLIPSSCLFFLLTKQQYYSAPERPWRVAECCWLDAGLEGESKARCTAPQPRHQGSPARPCSKQWAGRPETQPSHTSYAMPAQRALPAIPAHLSPALPTPPTTRQISETYFCTTIRVQWKLLLVPVFLAIHAQLRELQPLSNFLSSFPSDISEEVLASFSVSEPEP